MLIFKQITLVQFKNYIYKNWRFDKGIIAICGANGSGKTNLLDAIYYLCFTKSYFQRQDYLLSTHFKSGFRIEGLTEKNSLPFNLTAILRENNKKEFSVNDEEYKKLSQHIGLFPCVIIAPDDVQVITGTSDERRRMMDTMLCQFNSMYLETLIDYNKILQQRNSFLKNAAHQNQYNADVLSILDDQLCKAGNYIYEERRKLLEVFIPAVITMYQSIANKNEALRLTYDSQLNNHTFNTLLKENIPRDLFLQRTTCGIHKDDIDIQLQQQPFKQTASQGQRKSLLFALKLVEFDLLETQKGFTPVLLLDDVFEKLDAERMHQLLYKVCVEKSGQVFITDTHEERLSTQLKKLKVDFQLIHLNS
jgi:DNA replication and repair protein RecF